MGIYEGEEEVLVITNYNCPCLTGGIDCVYRVKCSSAIHLRPVLMAKPFFTYFSANPTRPNCVVGWVRINYGPSAINLAHFKLQAL